MATSKHRIENLGKRSRPRSHSRLNSVLTDKPYCNLQLRVIFQNRINPLKELPHDPRQHPTSRQLARWGVDERRDACEGVCHFVPLRLPISSPLAYLLKVVV